MNEQWRPPIFLSEEEIQSRISELGAKITDDYRDRAQSLVLVGVLKGSFLFMSDLARQIDLPLTCDFLRVQSYGDRTESSGTVRFDFDTTQPVKDMDVILVEDIIDTGITMDYLLANFSARQPRSLSVCSLLHKPARTLKEVSIDYLGFTIPNHFVIGYGLDYEGRYRNLPYIARVEDLDKLVK
ncbi:MAG: hypoxanthine phosphoribosyltransferase [Planctomycetota bacterium]|jgi:hypoxanthine phosphoribosyltransferase|nr:hypoxanthine phosphoribosyltransferase [Planctomycetota bacterium]